MLFMFHIITLKTGPKPPSPSLLLWENEFVAFSIKSKLISGSSNSSLSILVRAILSELNFNLSAKKNKINIEGSLVLYWPKVSSFFECIFDFLK